MLYSKRAFRNRTSAHPAALKTLLFVNLSTALSTFSGDAFAQAAQTYHVDAARGSDANTGLSSTAPWRSIAKVNSSSFPAGSQILLKRGESWSEKLIVRSSGTSASPIVIGAYGVGPNPILSGGGEIDNMLHGQNAHFIVVQDIDLVGWTERGLWNSGGDGWVVQRIGVEGGDSLEPDHGIRFSTASEQNISGGRIENNWIRTIGQRKNVGVFFAGILVQGATDIVVRSNTVNSENASGIFLGGGDGMLVEENSVQHCTSGITFAYTSNSLAQRNIISDGDGFGIGVGFQSNFVTLQGNLIYNMTYFENPGLFNGIDISNDSHNGKIYHNTVVGVARHSLVLAQDGNIDLRGWVIRNNIFDASENTGVPFNQIRILPLGIRNAVSFDEDHNVFVSREDGYVVSFGIGDGILYALSDYQRIHGKGQNSVDADPLFVDPANGNFRLREGSPAIGMGDSDLGFSDDVTGMPYQNSPSAGAYEFRLRPKRSEGLETQ